MYNSNQSYHELRGELFERKQNPDIGDGRPDYDYISDDLMVPDDEYYGVHYSEVCSDYSMPPADVNIVPERIKDVWAEYYYLSLQSGIPRIIRIPEIVLERIQIEEFGIKMIIRYFIYLVYLYFFIAFLVLGIFGV